MSFGNYKSLGETLKEFQITDTQANFITGVTFSVPEGVVNHSEFAVCENLVYPVLNVIHS
jgi:hypothetical protein